MQMGKKVVSQVVLHLPGNAMNDAVLDKSQNPADNGDNKDEEGVKENLPGRYCLH